MILVAVSVPNVLVVVLVPLSSFIGSLASPKKLHTKIFQGEISVNELAMIKITIFFFWYCCKVSIIFSMYTYYKVSRIELLGVKVSWIHTFSYVSSSRFITKILLLLCWCTIKQEVNAFQNMICLHNSEYLGLINTYNVNGPVATSWLCHHSIGIGSYLWRHTR